MPKFGILWVWIPLLVRWPRHRACIGWAQPESSQFSLGIPGRWSGIPYRFRAFIRVTLCTYRRDRFPVEDLTMRHFSKEAIERSAMGMLQNIKLERHLDRCLGCAKRIEKHRAWIAMLKHGLSEYLTSLDVLALQKIKPPQRRRYSLRIKL
jgi:hypothetical protein